MEDREIIALFLERDEAAVTAVSERFGAYCTAIAANILRDPMAAEECVNDAWLAAWNSIPPHQPDSMKAYLGKLVRRFAISKWRAEHAQKRGEGELPLILDELQVCVPSHALPDRVVEGQALTDSISRFLRTLPGPDRRLFVLRYWHCASIATIASAFGWSESKTTSRLFRLRKKLNRHLNKEEWL